MEDTAKIPYYAFPAYALPLLSQVLQEGPKELSDAFRLAVNSKAITVDIGMEPAQPDGEPSEDTPDESSDDLKED